MRHDDARLEHHDELSPVTRGRVVCQPYRRAVAARLTLQPWGYAQVLFAPGRGEGQVLSVDFQQLARPLLPQHGHPSRVDTFPRRAVTQQEEPAHVWRELPRVRRRCLLARRAGTRRVLG